MEEMNRCIDEKIEGFGSDNVVDEGIGGMGWW